MATKKLVAEGIPAGEDNLLDEAHQIKTFIQNDGYQDIMHNIEQLHDFRADMDKTKHTTKTVQGWKRGISDYIRKELHRR
ncbi:MAG TPA: hypothetical protein VND15_01515 [Candidatus Acidoferrales bacterium]|nr:hypothetical protein [Candidatus Acidoferrales bacterium]